MNRVVLAVGALVAAPLLIFLALSFRSNPNVIESPLLGTAAPAFELLDLDSGSRRLGDLKGKPVVLNFWASWCVPCVAENAVLADAARRYAGQVGFVGIVYQDDPVRIRMFQAQLGKWGPALMDPAGRTAIAYGVYGVPETFFIDRNGTIVHKITGAVDRASLERVLRDML